MKKLFILAAAAVAFAACSNNESDNQVQNSDNVIRLNSYVGDITRAASNLLETNFAEGTTVKVQVTDKAVSNAVSYEAINYTVGAAGVLTGASTQYYPAGGSNVKVYAYYPSNASTESNGFEVATDQNGDAAYQTSDLMYATVDPLTKNTTNTLTFNHVMSKITVTLIAGTGFTDAELNNATVTLKNVKYKGTFDPTTENIATVFTPADDLGNITITTDADNTAKSAIVVPQTGMAGKQLVVTIDGREMAHSITATEFVQGKNYIYNITVKKTGIEVSSAIGNWTNADAIADNLTY